jgi:hypothetical protein
MNNESESEANAFEKLSKNHLKITEELASSEKKLEAMTKERELMERVIEALSRYPGWQELRSPAIEPQEMTKQLRTRAFFGALDALRKLSAFRKEAGK